MTNPIEPANDDNKRPQSNQPKGKADNFDIFIANEIFPEASQVFGANFKTLQQVKNQCLVVIDTNALLVPYTVTQGSIEEIDKRYKDLIQNNRLFVPGQVAREFAKHRVTKLSELYHQLSSRRNSSSAQSDIVNHPLLKATPGFEDIVKFSKEFDDARNSYQKALGKAMENVKQWYWNDPVTLLYKGLFGDDVVFDPPLKQDWVRSELTRRQTHLIPPGYKDKGKPDDGVGDLLIWLTILELAKSKKKHLIFVSGDCKPDWWSQSAGQPLYPRFELVDEYRRISGGHSIHFVTFADFLDLFGASKEIVNEVRVEQINTSLAEHGVRPLDIAAAIGEWLRKNTNFGKFRPSGEYFDFETVKDGKVTAYFEVIYFSKHLDIARMERSLANLQEFVRDNTVTIPVRVFIIANSKSIAEKLSQTLKSYNTGFQNIRLRVGFMCEGEPLEVVWRQPR